MIKQVLLMGVAGAMCLLSLLFASGIGQAYHLTELSMYAVLSLFVLLPLLKVVTSGFANKREFYLTIAMALVFVGWPLIKGSRLQGLEYAWLLLLPYVVGQLKLCEDDIRAVGLTCGAFGFVVVAARLWFGVFDGWNENNIAMAGFLGCAVFMAAPWRGWTAKLLQKILLIAMTLMMLALDSRSCTIGFLVLTAFSFGLIPKGVFLKKDWLRRVCLVLPMLIALGTVLFQNSQVFVTLNGYSMEYFGKPIFNGRNDIWEHGFTQLMKMPLLGSGYINSGYWHNCAITVLTAFGIVGYGLWILYFEIIMWDATKFKEDKCLQCCVYAFLIIMFQQSFELGLVSTAGSMLPYLIIGIMLARMRYLRHRKSA